MKLGKLAKINIAWGVIVVGGVYSFYLAKKSIDKHRYESMKVRERIRKSNVGDYEPGPRKYAA